MKTSKPNTPKTAGSNSAAPIITALLAGVALGAVAVANKRKLAAGASFAAKKLDPVIDGTKSQFDKAVKATTTRFGDILINFGEAVERMRARRLQNERNRDLMHPQASGETDRLHAVG